MTEPLNPYRPPRSRVTTGVEPRPRKYEQAKRGRRFATYTIDFAIDYALSTSVGFATAFAAEPDSALPDLVELLAGLLVTFAYYFSMEASIGRTVGKLVTGTRVLREDGKPASTAQIAGRSAARLIPFDALSIFRSSARCWHDTLSKTVVVRAR
jgi:uncharacterized RDD family membrane protein YckC